MRCFQHNEREAVGTCMACGAGGCGECLIHYSGAKMCSGCADNVYRAEFSAAQEVGRVARKRLIRLAAICAFFFCVSLLVSHSLTMALFSAYGWGSVYMGTMPFVRAIGSRLSGGAISTSVTGALFGTFWFWLVTGWWLFLLGMLYSYLGGGIFHTIRAIQKWRSAETRASSIPPPALVSGLTTSTAPLPSAQIARASAAPALSSSSSSSSSKARLGAIAPAVIALLCVGYCSSQSLGHATGCGGPALAEGTSNEASALAASPAIARAPAPQATPALVQARAPSVSVPVQAPAVSPPPRASAVDAVSELLGRYYADLNSGQFDADRYFEPHVDRYITMMNTSTGAMNQYIRNVFPKQFKQHTFSLEPGSLVATQPSQYDYVERSEYLLVAKNKFLKQRVRVRITVSSGGKLTFLEQYKRLPWEELTPPPL